MYEYEKGAFGEFESFRVFDREKGNSVTVIAEHGGHLQEVTIGGVSVVDGFQTVEEMLANYKSKSAVLYPFPNRLKNGQYEHDGISYQFPINSASTGNAIHGFGRKVEMTLHSVELGDDEADIHLRYEYAGENPAYPFAFAFSLSFYFRKNGAFDASFGLHNFSNVDIPVGLGWHPYFKLGNTVNDLQMQLPKVERIEVDEFMIPTGVKTPYTDFQEFKTIGDTPFDTGFSIVEETPRATVLLKNDQHQIRYWQELGEGKFNFLQVYILPSRESIAFEPMTCNIDAFNNKDGLLVLKPGQGVMGRCGFMVEAV